MHSKFIAAMTGIIALVIGVALNASAEEQAVPESIVIASDGTDLPVYKHRADGDYLIIWLSSRFGFLDRSMRMAPVLAEKGLEVWQIDLAVAQFKPHGVKVMQQATGQYIVDLIEAAHDETGKTIVLLGQSFGTIPLLRGARLWQSREHEENYLAGAILFSPDVIATAPDAGEEPVYLPIAYETNIPILLYQEEKRGNRWYVNKLADALISGGSETFVGILPGVMAVLVEADDSPETLAALDALPERLVAGTKFLDGRPRPKAPAQKTEHQAVKPEYASVSSGLKPFRGDLEPSAITLNDLHGNPATISDYKGKVTVVNFWATWCPPCVKEIPSLNRLETKMAGKPFQLVAVNYAESGDEVQKFLKNFDMEFHTLMDSDGQQAKKWRVAAFPTTFIVGPSGKIRYGISAGLEWDGPEIIERLNELIKEIE
jgi:thiol-disulfide isomerase/thioredoxin